MATRGTLNLKQGEHCYKRKGGKVDKKLKIGLIISKISFAVSLLALAISVFRLMAAC